MASAARLKTSSGSSWTYDLPDEQLGSDSLEDKYNNYASEITHTRNGYVVSVRPFNDFTRWRYNLNATKELDIAQLLIFFKRRVFYLQPNGSDSLQYLVRWVEQEFIPEYISPDYYSITFTLEEVAE